MTNPTPPVDVRRQLRALIADRRSPDAALLFTTLMEYAHKRVLVVTRTVGQIAESDQEEIVGEVALQLVQGSLASFRGETLPELLGFVRTITDRVAWKVVRRRDTERRALATPAALDSVDQWASQPPGPDKYLETIPDSPLSDTDQGYLHQLVAAGSKAELARRAGVSRAAVTQRVQRIKERISALPANDRSAHEVWLRHAARNALDADDSLHGRIGNDG